MNRTTSKLLKNTSRNRGQYRKVKEHYKSLNWIEKTKFREKMNQQLETIKSK